MHEEPAATASPSAAAAPSPAAISRQIIIDSQITETAEHGAAGTAEAPAGLAHTPAATPRSGDSQRLRWQLGKCLGKGAFAEVFQGINTETSKFLAVKQIKLKNESCAAAKALQREIDVMIQLPPHRNIVKYLGTEQTKDRLFIFLEYISGGSISAMLDEFGALDESIVARYTHDLLCGLDFLHARSIAHCDIKGANLLVSEDGIVKLADFNSSKLLVDITQGGAQRDLRSLAGTPQFMAPEVAQQAGQSRKSDIWSVGCTVIQMLTASPPWNDSTNAMALIFRIGSTKGPPEFPPGISAACTDFLSLCFKVKPEDRPGCQQLLQHAFGGGGGAAEQSADCSSVRAGGGGGGGIRVGQVEHASAAAAAPPPPARLIPPGTAPSTPIPSAGGGGGGGERGPEGASASAMASARDTLVSEKRVALQFEDDCDLSLVCEGILGNVCSVQRGHGFAKIWAGGRLNVGLSGTEGQFAFEVHVLRELTVTMQEAGAASADTAHLCRVGWSTRRSPTHALGENEWGWGYGGTARKAHDGGFEAYGERFGAGDIITCGVDLGSGEVCFAKNGREFGVAYRLQRPCIQEGIVPHILLKNMEVRVDWSSRHFPSCLPGYLPLEQALALGACTSPVEKAVRPEVVMLIGLPACGKTTWARQHADKNPDARYTVLSTDLILEQMKVSGLTRNNYSVRFEQLMPEATSVLNKLVQVASKRRRNYLWDQTNVYASARKRKLAPFRDFFKRAVVMVLSSPSLEQRTRAREASEGKVVPEEAVQQMRSNFMLPSTSEGFDEVEFVGELTGQEAVAHVMADRKAAEDWLNAHKKRKADEEADAMRKRAQEQAHAHALGPGHAWHREGGGESMRSMNATVHAFPAQAARGGEMGGDGGGGRPWGWGGAGGRGGERESMRSMNATVHFPAQAARGGEMGGGGGGWGPWGWGGAGGGGLGGMDMGPGPWQGAGGHSPAFTHSPALSSGHRIAPPAHAYRDHEPSPQAPWLAAAQPHHQHPPPPQPQGYLSSVHPLPPGNYTGYQQQPAWGHGPPQIPHNSSWDPRGSGGYYNWGGAGDYAGNM